MKGERSRGKEHSSKERGAEEGDGKEYQVSIRRAGVAEEKREREGARAGEEAQSKRTEVENQVFKMLVQLTRPKKVIQLCSLSFDSIGIMLDCLPDDGCLVNFESEHSPYKCFAHDKKIHKRKGRKEDILKELAALGEQYDMVFIDATEENPINYYNLIMSGNMLRMNGVICVQNASTSSREGIDDEMGFMSREMTDVIKADARVEQVELPSDCGIFIVRRIPVSQTTDPLGFDSTRFAGIHSVAMAADISKEEDVKRMVDAIVANWGRVDIACNNAGINMNSASEDTTLEEWDKTFNVNLRGLFICCQAAGRVMLSQGYGKIINTASMASLIVPHPQKQLAYNTSKAGVVKLTQTLGTEWIDRGVRVNCISPGIVDTPLIHSEALKPLVTRWLADIPAGRLAQVTDLQAAVVYLASEASDYMTGHNLVIDGGQSLW
ncbi:PREDICTED: short-chain dehydrogenase reductase 5-like [Nanorana parkeri]|uniref:short-chain dehydrogenase reductase 5-like n=1 Tax=Nanorana parkeri TaxID=125878 RepID=UPI0008549B72|nr:PREDICTED: short-chain dehydrogenase reductase 5-like [Nanorana parkeri]